MNTDLLRETERLDDLLTHDLKIIQSDEVFSFSLDAVLLARFSSVPKHGKVLDLCTGNGVIPLLLSTRTKAAIDGVEIQERVHDMARRSVKLNGLEEQIRIIRGDLREYHQMAGYESYDAITVNPPYMPLRTGDLKVNEYQALARHEIACTLEDVILACKRLIRTGGKVAMVHRPSRLGEIVSLMRRHRLEPKRIRFVHPRIDMEANMVLIEALRDGKPDIRLLPPLIVYNERNEYCEELMQVYYGAREG
ncbi:MULTISPECIES: tRNA1(Val) (adenine(37)-N6)-methyltransferase [unclassified Paenibacillus]|uniref:tRNA1(Val) (adenine(37)-N6)-methyltransferase n=1 Tax=unclassified Paenibacillus TaxID=185978 RepID=UPI001C0FD7C4|nr:MULTISPECIES: tRNA1(Val) (adenine(37)-N6)-methyltransferase [unclassified Paenibacillus]MBU5444153.1 tRNA1(Val) (adenine(37)-N6)-methyltransferase [Paenibacillus sp. MSJ-34]CAH0121973.1 tRNA1(Val) (adenine(37)-N6)-methyltransferase [Paenibacillus sp. CECT 9249]